MSLCSLKLYCCSNKSLSQSICVRSTADENRKIPSEESAGVLYLAWPLFCAISRRQLASVHFWVSAEFVSKQKRSAVLLRSVTFARRKNRWHRDVRTEAIKEFRNFINS